jgi:hypothetical protein
MRVVHRELQIGPPIFELLMIFHLIIAHLYLYRVRAHVLVLVICIISPYERLIL